MSWLCFLEMKTKQLNRTLLLFREFDDSLPIHSYFWKVKNLDENVQEVSLFAEFYNTNHFVLSEMHKPMGCPFYLNKNCKPII